MSSPLIQEVETRHSPESLTARLYSSPGPILLRSGTMEHSDRFSLVAARPFLRVESFGSRCIIRSDTRERTLFGNPWKLLESLANRYELLEEIDLPFPLGGCFGYFGYELKQFVEPRLPLTALNDLELPECSVGFYDSLVVFDHQLGKVWLISTGLDEEGDRCPKRTQAAVEFWTEHLASLGQADLVLHVLDASEPPDPDAEARLAELADRNCIVVLNKSDLPSLLGQVDMHGSQSVPVSCLNRDGIEALKDAIRASVWD